MITAALQRRLPNRWLAALFFSTGLAVLLNISLLAGCSDPSELPTADPGEFLDTRANLIEDPDFATISAGPIRHWVLVQHAGGKSYAVTAENGVMTLERTGSEPWGLVSQRLDAVPLRGKTLEFSADVRGRFPHPEDATGSPTAIGIQVKGLKPGMPRGLGAAVLVAQHAEPGLIQENSDWVRQKVRFDIPDTATFLALNIMLSQWGQLDAAKPSLVEISKNSARVD